MQLLLVATCTVYSVQCAVLYPLGVSAHQFAVSIPVVSPRDIQPVRDTKGDGFATSVGPRHQESQIQTIYSDNSDNTHADRTVLR